LRTFKYCGAPFYIFTLVVLLYGCIPAPPFISGRDITEEQLIPLKSTRVDKTELMDLLGPPYAIFKIGEIANVPRGAAWDSSGGTKMATYEKVDSNVAFTLFPGASQSQTDKRVYYYYYSKSSKTGYFLLLAIHEKVKNRVEELYVLVNERSGFVEDYFYKGSDNSVSQREEVHNKKDTTSPNFSRLEQADGAVKFKNGDVVLVEFKNGDKKEVTVTNFNDKFLVGNYEVSSGVRTQDSFDLRSVKSIMRIK